MKFYSIYICVCVGGECLASFPQHNYYTHVVTCIESAFIFIAEWHRIVWIHQNLFIHLHVYRHMDCFQFLAIKNRVAIIAYKFFIPQLSWGIIGIQKNCTKLMYTIWWFWTYSYYHHHNQGDKLIQLQICTCSSLLPFVCFFFMYGKKT